MPELPEVETIRQDLEIIQNQKITEVFRSNYKMRFDSSLSLKSLIDCQIKKVERKARYLVIKTNSNTALIIHLGMSGRLILGHQFQKLKHDHFACKFENQQWLIFNDPRRFGFVDLVLQQDLTTHPNLSKLGVEPLSVEFDAQHLQKQLAKKTINIKTAIMDNQVVVGVGNIYASESLFDAKISPLRVANSLTKNECKKLVESIKKILTQAIENRGSSISDFVNTKGHLGNFQNFHLVYDREDKSCKTCDGLIKRIVQNARSSFYCLRCQK
jgi:formamidopyrimidine-DNA glycosylase